jgi:2-hydroxy-6-oxonona-2,4-dienedioate hydrolase
MFRVRGDVGREVFQTTRSAVKHDQRRVSLVASLHKPRLDPAAPDKNAMAQEQRPARPIQSDIKSSRAAAAANPTWDNIREIFKGLFHDEKQIWDDLIATRLSLYSRPDMKQAMSHILALLDPEVYNRNRIPDEAWRTLRAPTLVIAAVDHRDVFLDTARAIAELIPNVTVFEMKHCSHWPQMEDPDTFNKRSLAFLLAG